MLLEILSTKYEKITLTIEDNQFVFVMVFTYLTIVNTLYVLQFGLCFMQREQIVVINNNMLTNKKVIQI